MTPRAQRNLGIFLSLIGSTIDETRRVIKMMITLCVIHLVLLVIVHTALQMAFPGFYNTSNSLWGTFMVLTLILGLWWFGGPELDAVLVASLELDLAQRIIHAISYFIAIETTVNMCFAVIPGGSLRWIAAAISAAMSILAIKFMIGGGVNWKQLYILPLTNLIISIAALYYRWYINKEPSPSDSSFWFFAGVAVIFLTGFSLKLFLVPAVTLFIIGLLIEFRGVELVKSKRPVVSETKNALSSINKAEQKSKADEIIQLRKDNKISNSEAADRLHALAEEEKENEEILNSNTRNKVCSINRQVIDRVITINLLPSCEEGFEPFVFGSNQKVIYKAEYVVNGHILQDKPEFNYGGHRGKPPYDRVTGVVVGEAEKDVFYYHPKSMVGQQATLRLTPIQ